MPRASGKGNTWKREHQAHRRLTRAGILWIIRYMAPTCGERGDSLRAEGRVLMYIGLLPHRGQPTRAWGGANVANGPRGPGTTQALWPL